MESSLNVKETDEHRLHIAELSFDGIMMDTSIEKTYLGFGRVHVNLAFITTNSLCKKVWIIFKPI